MPSLRGLGAGFFGGFAIKEADIVEIAVLFCVIQAVPHDEALGNVKADVGYIDGTLAATVPAASPLAYTPSVPLTSGQHSWAVYAVDRVNL